MLRRLNEKSWKELDALKKEEVYLVLPISSLEQHGIHLPVGTDDFTMEAALKDLVDCPELKGDFWLLPSIHYGISPEHLDFCGSFTLTPQTLCAVVEDLIHCMTVHGWKNLVLLNSHGGNTSLLHGMAQTWKRKFGVDIFHVDFWGSDFFNDAASMLQTPIQLDIHGGEIETSLLLYSRPQVVKEAELKTMTDDLPELPKYRGSWTAKELSPKGALGGATKASVETGKALSEFVKNKVISQLEAIARGEG